MKIKPDRFVNLGPESMRSARWLVSNVRRNESLGDYLARIQSDPEPSKGLIEHDPFPLVRRVGAH